MIFKLFCKSKATKSCSDELDSAAAKVVEALASSFENATRNGLSIEREKSFLFMCSWLFPRSLGINSRYSDTMIRRTLNCTKASRVHRGLTLTHGDTSRHDLRNLKGILIHSRSPPAQLIPSLHAGWQPWA